MYSFRGEGGRSHTSGAVGGEIRSGELKEFPIFLGVGVFCIFVAIHI